MPESKSSKMIKKIFSCFSGNRDGVDSKEKRHRRKMVIVGDGECGKSCLLTRMKSGTFEEKNYTPTVFETEVLDVNIDGEDIELVVNDTAGQEDYDRLRPLSYTDVDVAIICFSIAEPDSLVNVSEKWASEVRYFCGQNPVILVGNKKDIRDQPIGSSVPMNPSSTSLESQDDLDGKSVSSVSTQTDDCQLEKMKLSKRIEERLGSYRVASRTPSMNSTSKPFYRHKEPVKHKEGVRMANLIGAAAYFETSALTGDNVQELLQAVTKAAMLGSKKVKKFKPLTDTLKS